MNFKSLSLDSTFSSLVRKQEREYFEKARNLPTAKRQTPADEVHRNRQWVTDVINLFAERMSITPAQAKQQLQQLDCMALKRTWARAAEKLPKTVMTISGERRTNPRYQDLIDQSGMEINQILDRARRSFDMAIGIRHPDKIVVDRGSGEYRESKFLTDAPTVSLALAIINTRPNAST